MLEFVICHEYLSDAWVPKNLFSDLDGQDGTDFLVKSVPQRAILLMGAFRFVFLDKLGLLLDLLKFCNEWRPISTLPNLASTCRSKVPGPLL